MAERELAPNYDNSFDAKTLQPFGAENLQQKVESGRSTYITSTVRQYLFDNLANFEYEVEKFDDVSMHILNDDEDYAMEDSMPMFTFFGLCVSKAKKREKQIADKLKEMENTFERDSKKTITQQRGETKQTQDYKQWNQLLIKVSHIRRNCEVLRDAMEMRLNSTRTKRADARPQQQPGVWDNRKQP